MSTVEEIRTARKKKGWSQDQLATAVGVKRSVISKYENGTISPSMDMLRSIADALEINIMSLIEPNEGHWSAFTSYLDKKLIELIKLDYDSSLDFYTAFLRNEVSIMMLYDDNDKNLQKAYAKLNPEGRRVATARVEELTEIPRYQRPKKPQPIPRVSEGKDTTPTEPPPESPETGE